jgi:starch-binding outer membrane protein, SusD/RagB family
LNSVITDDLPLQSNQQQVYDQAAADLQMAMNMLPASYPSPADLGRVTKGAAHALMAKVMMQQHKWNEAEAALNWLVVGEGRSNYTLVPDYRSNFLSTTENNAESVFEIQFATNPSENTDIDTRPNSNYGNSLPQFFAPPPIGWSDGEANRWLVREYNKERTATGDRDPRLPASLLFDSTDVRGPAFTRIYGQTFNQRLVDIKNPARVWFRKFQNDFTRNVEGYNTPNNWRYIRYADVLLMYAEVLNELGNTAGAYPHVDQVRQRAGLAPLSTAMPGLTQVAFREQLKHERITELNGEGHRWNDLARWGDLQMPETIALRDPAFANFEVGTHELLPLPQSDVDANPNLTQNHGW